MRFFNRISLMMLFMMWLFALISIHFASSQLLTEEPIQSNHTADSLLYTTTQNLLEYTNRTHTQTTQTRSRAAPQSFTTNPTPPFLNPSMTRSAKSNSTNQDQLTRLPEVNVEKRLKEPSYVEFFPPRASNQDRIDFHQEFINKHTTQYSTQSNEQIIANPIQYTAPNFSKPFPTELNIETQLKNDLFIQIAEYMDTNNIIYTNDIDIQYIIQQIEFSTIDHNLETQNIANSSTQSTSTTPFQYHTVDKSLPKINSQWNALKVSTLSMETLQTVSFLDVPPPGQTSPWGNVTSRAMYNDDNGLEIHQSGSNSYLFQSWFSTSFDETTFLTRDHVDIALMIVTVSEYLVPGKSTCLLQNLDDAAPSSYFFTIDLTQQYFNTLQSTNQFITAVFPQFVFKRNSQWLQQRGLLNANLFLQCSGLYQFIYPAYNLQSPGKSLAVFSSMAVTQKFALNIASSDPVLFPDVTVINSFSGLHRIPISPVITFANTGSIFYPIYSPDEVFSYTFSMVDLYGTKGAKLWLNLESKMPDDTRPFDSSMTFVTTQCTPTSAYDISEQQTDYEDDSGGDINMAEINAIQDDGEKKRLIREIVKKRAKNPHNTKWKQTIAKTAQKHRQSEQIFNSKPIINPNNPVFSTLETTPACNFPQVANVVAPYVEVQSVICYAHTSNTDTTPNLALPLYKLSLIPKHCLTTDCETFSKGTSLEIELLINFAQNGINPWPSHSRSSTCDAFVGFRQLIPTAPSIRFIESSGDHYLGPRKTESLSLNTFNSFWSQDTHPSNLVAVGGFAYEMESYDIYFGFYLVSAIDTVSIADWLQSDEYLYHMVESPLTGFATNSLECVGGIRFVHANSFGAPYFVVRPYDPALYNEVLAVVECVLAYNEVLPYVEYTDTLNWTPKFGINFDLPATMWTVDGVQMPVDRWNLGTLFETILTNKPLSITSSPIVIEPILNQVIYFSLVIGPFWDKPYQNLSQHLLIQIPWVMYFSSIYTNDYLNSLSLNCLLVNYGVDPYQLQVSITLDKSSIIFNFPPTPDSWWNGATLSCLDMEIIILRPLTNCESKAIPITLTHRDFTRWDNRIQNYPLIAFVQIPYLALTKIPSYDESTQNDIEITTPSPIIKGATSIVQFNLKRTQFFYTLRPDFMQFVFPGIEFLQTNLIGKCFVVSRQFQAGSLKWFDRAESYPIPVRSKGNTIQFYDPQIFKTITLLNHLNTFICHVPVIVRNYEKDRPNGFLSFSGDSFIVSSFMPALVYAQSKIIPTLPEPFEISVKASFSYLSLSDTEAAGLRLSLNSVPQITYTVATTDSGVHYLYAPYTFFSSDKFCRNGNQIIGTIQRIEINTATEFPQGLIITARGVISNISPKTLFTITMNPTSTAQYCSFTAITLYNEESAGNNMIDGAFYYLERPAMAQIFPHPDLTHSRLPGASFEFNAESDYVQVAVYNTPIYAGNSIILDLFKEKTEGDLDLEQLVDTDDYTLIVTSDASSSSSFVKQHHKSTAVSNLNLVNLKSLTTFEPFILAQFQNQTQRRQTALATRPFVSTTKIQTASIVDFPIVRVSIVFKKDVDAVTNKYNIKFPTRFVKSAHPQILGKLSVSIADFSRQIQVYIPSYSPGVHLRFSIRKSRQRGSLSRMITPLTFSVESSQPIAAGAKIFIDLFRAGLPVDNRNECYYTDPTAADTTAKQLQFHYSSTTQYVLTLTLPLITPNTILSIECYFAETPFTDLEFPITAVLSESSSQQHAQVTATSKTIPAPPLIPVTSTSFNLNISGAYRNTDDVAFNEHILFIFADYINEKFPELQVSYSDFDLQNLSFSSSYSGFESFTNVDDVLNSSLIFIPQSAEQPQRLDYIENPPFQLRHFQNSTLYHFETYRSQSTGGFYSIPLTTVPYLLEHTMKQLTQDHSNEEPQFIPSTQFTEALLVEKQIYNTFRTAQMDSTLSQYTNSIISRSSSHSHFTHLNNLAGIKPSSIRSPSPLSTRMEEMLQKAVFSSLQDGYTQHDDKTITEIAQSTIFNATLQFRASGFITPSHVDSLFLDLPTAVKSFNFNSRLYSLNISQLGSATQIQNEESCLMTNKCGKSCKALCQENQLCDSDWDCASRYCFHPKSVSVDASNPFSPILIFDQVPAYCAERSRRTGLFLESSTPSV